MCSLCLEVRVLEKKRDAVVIEDEDNVASYYKMREHISKLSIQMQVSHTHNPGLLRDEMLF